MAATDGPSPGEKRLPDLELRKARPGRVVSTLAETKQRYGEIYLIERQAIELRRLRWSKGPKEVQRAKDPTADTRGFDRPAGERAPPPPKASPLEVLRPYERPRPDSSHADESVLSRTAAWLRQTLLGL